MKHLRLLVLAFAVFIPLMVATGSAPAVEHPVLRPGTLVAIDEAFSHGEITEGEAYLYKLAWVKNSAILPERFFVDDAVPMKSATQLLLEIEEKMDSFPSDIQKQIEDLRSRPVCQTYVNTARFRVHYDTTGTHMIRGWPNTDYRDAVVEAVEYCYGVYHVDHLWQVPPGDGSAGGGLNLIDCYVRNLTGGILGYAQTENSVPGDSWPNNYTGFFVIDNDYSGYGNYLNKMRATLAHEYMHIIQFGYTVANSWWMENVAMWGEELCYDHINDYIPYIYQYMFNPFKMLPTYDGAFEYGACVWPIYITDRFDDIDLVRQIYHCTGTTSTHTCFDNVLGQVGYNFATALAEWHVWNFYTHLRDDGQHFDEGSTWSYYLMFDKQYGGYPQYDQVPTTTKRPAGTAASVMRFVPVPWSDDNLLTVTFNGPNCTQQVVVICKLNGAHVFQEYYMNLNSSGDGTLEIPGWDEIEYAHMISTYPIACSYSQQNYTFDLVTSLADPGSVGEPPLYTRTVDLAQNQPNPFAGNTSISYNLPSDGEVAITIYDAGGRQVRSLVRAEQRPGEHVVRWDGRDDLGREVAPGSYFYRLNAGGVLQTRKMILAD